MSKEKFNSLSRLEKNYVIHSIIMKLNLDTDDEEKVNSILVKIDPELTLLGSGKFTFTDNTLLKIQDKLNSETP